MTKSGYPGVTALAVLSELCNLKSGESMPIGILEDNVKSRLSDYLKDGRTRSVKHGIEKLENYGILSKKVTEHGELSYSLRFFWDDERTIFLYLLSAIEDLTDTVEAQERPLILPEPRTPEEATEINGLKSQFESLAKGYTDNHKDWDIGIAQYNPLEYIELLLWEYAKTGMASNYFKKAGVEVPSSRLSILSFFGTTVGTNPIELRRYYSSSAIERLYFGLFYFSEIVLAHSGHIFLRSDKADINKYSTFIVYKLLTVILQQAIDKWIDLRLKNTNEIPIPTSFRNEVSFITIGLYDLKDSLPIGIIEKFNIR